MPNPVLICENGGGRILSVGIAGFDTANQDLGAYDYTAELISEFVGPPGYGEVQFKMLTIHLRRVASYVMTMKVYVDGAQTEIFNSAGDLIDQDFSFTGSAPTQEQMAGGDEAEDTIEAHLGPGSIGNKISIHLTITSSNIVGGVFLPEMALVHFLPYGVKVTSTGETQ